MIKEIQIKLWDEVIGYAAYKDNKFIAFEYSKTFPAIYDLAPIMMPRSKDQVWSFDLNYASYHGLPGLLADALPDSYGLQVMDAWFSSQGLALGDITALDRLCYLGTRAMGALEFEPQLTAQDQNRTIEIDKLVQLSQEILTKRLEFKAYIDDLSPLLQIGSSAGGARPKAIVAINPKTGELRSGQIAQTNYEQWLIKLDSLEPSAYTNIEYAYHLMALDCGIEMMESKLLEEQGRSHFLTKRFDRSSCGEKLHMQTLCALAHLDYSEARVHSYEILFRIANLLALTAEDHEQIFRRMVFNVLAKNCDDHTKNFSFLLDKDAKWRLAPAYDLTYAYNPNNYWLREHNMLINGKSNNINAEDLLSYANKFHIKNAKQVIAEIGTVIKDFKHYAKKAGIPKEQTIQISAALGSA